MRKVALIVLALGAASAIEPAVAQPRGGYPICLRVVGPDYYECAYTSFAQCNASASGRAAQCVLSPFVANASEPRPRGRRRPANYY